MSATRASFFATAPTVQALERARAVVALIGGYDGSGNFGDIAQFDAALNLVDRLGVGIVALPVLEREYLASHRQLSEDSGVDAPNALFFDLDGKAKDGLMPVAAPVELAFGACYLYGGGYLNRLWGDRKLAMLEAAEALFATGGVEASCRISSGLQVEPDWLSAGSAATLARFDLLGARDESSRQALAAIGADAAAITTGDDAVGLLGHLPALDALARSEDRLCLNLHFAEHEWVSERPQSILDFYTGFVAELGRLANRPLTIQPLVAYLDRRVDERSATERLCGACAASGAEVAEPLVLRPAALAGAASQLRRARMTLSCSYHVALTSLMLGVPALLVGDSPYYQQKAAGLREDFGPLALTTTSNADPAPMAREIGTLLLDAGRGAELRTELATCAERLWRRRAAAETHLLGRLGGASSGALGGQATELAERLRLRSAEPAELRVRLARMETELEELQRRAAESPLEAELRAQEAEVRAAEAHRDLAVVLGSSSWRMTSPLRRLRGLLRRR